MVRGEGVYRWLGEGVLVVKENDICLFVSAAAEPPAIDICFAISATTADAINTFIMMKDTIQNVIDDFGVDQVHYSTIVFASDATLLVPFDSRLSGPAQLKSLISTLPRSVGGSSLDKALVTALEAFEDNIVRPNAKKVLVIITDNTSGFQEDQISSKAKQLEQRGIRVIAVAVGSDADPKQLKYSTSDGRDVLEVPKSENPKYLSKDIMRLALIGKLTLK